MKVILYEDKNGDFCMSIEDKTTMLRSDFSADELKDASPASYVGFLRLGFTKVKSVFNNALQENDELLF